MEPVSPGELCKHSDAEVESVANSVFNGLSAQPRALKYDGLESQIIQAIEIESELEDEGARF